MSSRSSLSTSLKVTGPLVVAAALVAACGSSSADRGFDTSGAATDPSAPPPGTLGSSGGGASSGNVEEQACAALVTTAKRAEVDILVVIDTSGSMGEETAQVQQNINTFAATIGNSGLDYRVIMMADKPVVLPFPVPFPPTGICVPPPLGGASCADNPPIFHHPDIGVGSTDSLSTILSDLPKYEAWLRPSAFKVFIEVTDDNSALPWNDFDTQLLAKAPQHFGDANARRYIFDAICGYKRNTPVLSNQKCSTAENTGDQYQHLAQLTGGIVDSVCETDYSGVFGNIAKGLVTKLGCEFDVPKAADGSTTDPSKVVVRYTPGSGAPTAALTQVTDAGKCATVTDGWYYDDNANPKKILFCPTTCGTAGADTAGKLEIAAGCKAPPPK